MKGITCALALATCLSACDAEGPAPTGPQLTIHAAALSLDDVTNVCYGLSVSAASGPVWSLSGVCADDYGDGEGAITYIGPCDATQDVNGDASNNVTLVLESVEQAPGADGGWVNPCPAPEGCAQFVQCVENADVAVTFNLTLMRDAAQGFFDIAVEFEDVFCSAKLDCVDELLNYDCAANACGNCGDGTCEGGESNLNCQQDCFCGDGRCTAGEDNSCVDCAFCGDGLCQADALESFANCPNDCTCGNGICDVAEYAEQCPTDCPACDGQCYRGEPALAECPSECPCGDGICQLNLEDNGVCPQDCPAGTCGDEVCNQYAPFFETPDTCPGDCTSLCGDFVCDPDETFEACIEDCSCNNGQCDLGFDFGNGCGIQCTCGNGSCDVGYPYEETATNCSVDCYCGDGRCDITSEDPAGCPADCVCGDGVCSPGQGEYQQGCAIECTCGNGFCGVPEENQVNCETDCGFCGDGSCQSSFEDQSTCSADCGVCGDGTCVVAEAYSCPADCGTCGDGTCNPFESILTCPGDCLAALCGNETCDPFEDYVACPSDCPNGCGDGNCFSYENATVCPSDCPCGDGTCQPFESPSSCSADCPSCPSGTCEYFESHETCPQDCPNPCGDGTCEYFESFATCPADCDNPCGDGECAYNEDYQSCPADCVICAGYPCASPSGGGRGETVVVAFACTAGEGQDTQLSLTNLSVDCGDEYLTVDPGAGPGNLIPDYLEPNTILYQAATYQGRELLGDYNKVYLNIALGVIGEGCTIDISATASDGRLSEEGNFPYGRIYPFIRVHAPVTDEDGVMTCTEYPLGTPEVAPHYYVPGAYDPSYPSNFRVFCGLDGCEYY